MAKMSFSSLVALLLLLLVISSSNAQNYIPKPPPMTTCPSGYSYTSIGSDNVASLGTFAATSQTIANYVMTTLFNGTAGVVVSQLSFGITDNSAITSVINLRLALFKVTKEDTTSPQLSMLAQTAEIQLFATPPDIIYGNLLNNVTLQPGLYAMGVWSNIAIRTGIAPIAAGAIKNVAYVYYSSTGLSSTLSTNSYTYGFRALQAHACVPASNPYTDPTNRLVNFCAYLQLRNPAASATSYQYQYAARTVTYTLGGTLAISTSDTGSSIQGGWGRVKAGHASMVTQTTSDMYYQSMSQQSDTLIIGGGTSNLYNQQLYSDINGYRVDNQGISFTSNLGAQFIVSFTNGTYQITKHTGAFVERYNAIVSGFTTSDASTLPTCVPPQSYNPDSSSCDVGSYAMKFGDSDLTNSQYMYSSATSYVYANYLYTRPFTAWTAQTSLRQLSMVVSDNVGIIANLRMGLFVSEVGVQYPTLTLVAQTRQVELRNVQRQVIRINLINEIELEQGKNYSIGFIADQSLYAPYAYFVYNPIYYGLPYNRFMTENGFPQTVSTQSTSMVTAMGATGCARQQTTRQMSFCAAFVYASYSTTYSGVLDVLSTSQQSDLGSYNLVVGGQGVYNQTYTTGTTVPRILNFSINNYNHPANWKLYNNPITPRRYLDSNGIAAIIQTTTGFSGSLSTFWDPLSASWEYIERQQTMSSTIVTTVAMLVSEMSVAEYNGVALPTCVPPPRPLNAVSPASVARFQCPNNENSISEVWGDSSVGDFEVNADGTLIQANRIYTQRFVATSTATVRQLAIGILRNTDRPTPILVRLGLYAASDNSLLGQASQLTLNQAVDQLIIMNLPSVVTVTSGQSYHIALIANNPLEVATSRSANSPSMSSVFSTTGLPTTFVSGGNDVSVSIAAYACARSSHSFCSYYQYYDASMGRSLAYFYQGLLQADGQATDLYGTYQTIYAASGRLTQYSRSTTSVTSAITVFTFYQQPNDEGRLYTQSTNDRPLNAQGIRLLMSTGTESVLNFNASNNMMDESFQVSTLDVFLKFSQFTYTPLAANVPLPTCGLGAIPTTFPVAPPDVVCPAGQSSLVHGSANSDDLEYPRESYAVNANQAVFNTFTTGPQATMVHQLKVGVNANRNLVNRIRLGLYSSNFTFLGTSETISLLNPGYGIVTGSLISPVYLNPLTVYYIGVWSENAFSTGYGGTQATSFSIDFSGGWPNWLDREGSGSYNNERALAAVGCSTPIVKPPLPTASSSSAAPAPASSSTGTVPTTPGSSTGSGTTPVPGETSSSSDGLSKGAVAGIVIGCVIATNLVLLACLWLTCFGCGAASGKRSSTDEIESSRAS